MIRKEYNRRKNGFINVVDNFDKSTETIFIRTKEIRRISLNKSTFISSYNLLAEILN